MLCWRWGQPETQKENDHFWALHSGPGHFSNGFSQTLWQNPGVRTLCFPTQHTAYWVHNNSLSLYNISIALKWCSLFSPHVSRSQQLIKAAFLKNDLLKNLNDREIKAVITCMYPTTINQDCYVIQEGTTGAQAYILDGKSMLLHESLWAVQNHRVSKMLRKDGFMVNVVTLAND